MLALNTSPCILDSAAAQFNLAKLILRHQRTKGRKTTSSCTGNGTSSVSGGTSEATLEAKALLHQVLRDNKDHAAASLCLARLLAEEGGTPGVGNILLET